VSILKRKSLFKNLFFIFFREYYFSTENLEADIFLRQQMSKDGYVPLSLIANFNRVKSLCNDIHFIADVRLKIFFFSFLKKSCYLSRQFKIVLLLK